MEGTAAGLILVIIFGSSIIFGGFLGNTSSMNYLTATQYTQAQDKCKEHEGVYSVGVMKDKVKVFCKDNVEFVLEKK